MSPYEPITEPRDSAARARRRPGAARAASIEATRLGLYRHPPIAWRPSPLARVSRAAAEAGRRLLPLGEAASRGLGATLRPRLAALGRAAWGEVRWRPERSVTGLAAYVAVAAALLVLVNAVIAAAAAASGTALHPRLSREVAEYFQGTSTASLALLVGVVGPTIEELLFRFVPATLSAALGVTRAWWWRVGVAASLLFALAHVHGAAGGIPLGQFVGGLAFWHMQGRYGLVGAIALHGTFNVAVLGLARVAAGG